MRNQIRVILNEATKHESPAAFEIDLARDIQYLYEHSTQQFVWCLYDNGTQLLPADTDIPSPFEGGEPYDGLGFARAFLATYGDITDEDGSWNNTRWYIYDRGTFTHNTANEALHELAVWRQEAWNTEQRRAAEYAAYAAQEEQAGEQPVSRRLWESIIRNTGGVTA